MGLLTLSTGVVSGCGGDTAADAGTDAGTTSDASLSIPDGAVVLPDGAIALPDGGLLLDDGGVFFPDGGVIFPDGGVPVPDGGIVLPDGAVVGPDAGTTPDGGLNPDAGNGTPDAGSLPDLGIPGDAGVLPMECEDGNGVVDICACLLTADCSSSACPTGTVCEDDGCGGMRCLGGGHPCVDATDCPNGGNCVSTPSGSVCQPSGPNCRDNRECPLGFTCESNSCVDRRVFCDGTENACPVGYVCDFVSRQAQAFCRRLDEACEHDETCPQPGACFDLDGDGSKECVPEALECVADTCALIPGRLCGPQPEEKSYSCGFHGSCAIQACDDPFVCTDFADDGRPFCAPPGSCDAHADCSTNEICALPHLEMTPRCVGVATGSTP